MMNGRHFRFWLVTFLVLAACLWLLHDILLPFVAGIALAYVYAPIADRMERAGMNRTVAALLIVTVFIVTLIALTVLLVPLLLQQGSALISHIPGYYRRVKELIADSNLPWLSALMGSGDETVSGLVSQVATWLLSFVYSIWTGGKALVSFASVLIVMPVVTFT
jgi:predicted PurR-regulated permease PerM